jgi:hypothetical protein
MSTAAEQTKGDGIAPVEGLEAGEAKTGAAEPEASVCEDAESKPERALPPLSDHEFKQYNRLAEHMNYFVSLLKHTPFPFPLPEEHSER